MHEFVGVYLYVWVWPHAAAERPHWSQAKFVRIHATTECYRSNFRSQKRGHRKCVPGCGKKPPECTERARWFNDKHSSRDRPDNSTEKYERGWVKTDHPGRPSLSSDCYLVCTGSVEDWNTCMNGPYFCVLCGTSTAEVQVLACMSLV